MSYQVTIPEGLTSHQIVERLKADANLVGRDRGRAAGRLAAARDLRHRARHARQADRRPHAGRGPQADGEGLGAAQEGPAAEVAGGGRRSSPRSWRRRPGAATSASAWRPCSSTGCAEHAPAVRSHHPLRADRRQDRVEPADPEERDRPEDLAQHLPDRRPAADADLQPGPRRDRGRAQSGRHQGALFRRRRQPAATCSPRR